jgi:hypothetical protein
MVVNKQGTRQVIHRGMEAGFRCPHVFLGAFAFRHIDRGAHELDDFPAWLTTG